MSQMFLKINGVPNCEGESQDHKHSKEIEVKSWTWSATNKVKWDINQGGQSTKMDLSAISIQKTVDATTHVLFQFCSNGKHIPEAVLTARKAAGDDQVEYLIIRLTNVMISLMKWDAAGEDQFVNETVELSFAQFKMEYNTQDDAGNAINKGSHGWNVQTAKAA